MKQVVAGVCLIAIAAIWLWVIGELYFAFVYRVLGVCDRWPGGVLITSVCSR